MILKALLCKALSQDMELLRVHMLLELIRMTEGAHLLCQSVTSWRGKVCVGGASGSKTEIR